MRSVYLASASAEISMLAIINTIKILQMIVPAFFRNLLNPVGQLRIDELQPYHSGDSPEEAVQQVDTTA